MNKNLLFVVHRYYPYPGGSEVYVRNMALEMKSRGYNITVLAGTHMGDLEGIKVTDNYEVLLEPWDLIIVHGGDVYSQDFVHVNHFQIPSPVLYMIIKPPIGKNGLLGTQNHAYLGYSTAEDWEWIVKHNKQKNARRVRHGIPSSSLGSVEPANRWNKKYFMSAGGFWPHKGFNQLCETFSNHVKDPDRELYLFGYSEHIVDTGGDPRIRVFKGLDNQSILNYMAGAEAYVLNSSEEGFGLVLLEAMYNHVPWIARNIAGAAQMAHLGLVYKDTEQLGDFLKFFDKSRLSNMIDKAYAYVSQNHMIKNTGNDLEAVVKEAVEKYHG